VAYRISSNAAAQPKGTVDGERKLFTGDAADFYKRRGDWYPILPGDDKATHRFVGGILVVFAIIITVAMLGMHVL